MADLAKNKAQSTAEYVIVLGLIVGVVLAMQTYIKRGFQARIKQATNYVEGSTHITGSGVNSDGIPYNFERPEGVDFVGEQYEPYYTQSYLEREQTASKTTGLKRGGAFSKNIEKEELSVTGTQQINAPRE